MKHFFSIIKRFKETKSGKIIKKSVEYFLIVAVSLLIGTLFEAFIFQYPIKMIFNPSPLVYRLVISILDLTTIFTAIYFFVSKESYETKLFNIKEIAVCSIILLILHNIYAYTLGYVIYSAGPVYNFGCLLYYGNHQTNIKHHILELPTYMKLISFFIFQFTVYLPAIFFGAYFGVKRRKKHEKQLIEYCNTNNQSSLTKKS